MSDRAGENNAARFEFGDQCPKIGSWFFPIDPSEKPRLMEQGKEGEDDDSSQSS
jgi:hypothetical protein